MSQQSEEFGEWLQEQLSSEPKATTTDLRRRRMEQYLHEATKQGYEVMGITHETPDHTGLITLVDEEMYVLEVEFSRLGRLKSETILTNHFASEVDWTE